MKKQLFFWGCVLAVVLTVLAGCQLFGSGDEFKVIGGIVRSPDNPLEAAPLITVLDADNNPITDASVSVDGITLAYNTSLASYGSTTAFTTADDRAHNLEVSCNSKTVTASVTMPHIPTLSVPDPYDASAAQTCSYSISTVPDSISIMYLRNGELYTEDASPPSTSGTFIIPANNFLPGQEKMCSLKARNRSLLNDLLDGSSFSAEVVISEEFTTQ